MNPTTHSISLPTETPDAPATAPVSPVLIADWRRFVFLHFAMKPGDLAPHVPHPLDLHDGHAWVSLVSFRLERMRPARVLPAAVGRALLRPISDHEFLNVRTYVRGPAGPGIHFLAEWVNNPISARLGPVFYGLPYRLAEMTRVDSPAGGLAQIRVADRKLGSALGITVPIAPDGPLTSCAAGSADAFLLERYCAYTHQVRADRYFHIKHPPWSAARIDLARFDTSLVEAAFPWFRHAEYVSAHISPGFNEVLMGGPRLIVSEAAEGAPALAKTTG